MNNQPLDKGRLVAVVDYYPVKGETNQDGSQKMKPKYMAIGEVTKWPNDQGGSYTQIDQYLNPPSLPAKTRIFWDSENPNNQQQAAPQQAAPQQAPQQNYQPAHQGYTPQR